MSDTPEPAPGSGAPAVPPVPSAEHPEQAMPHWMREVLRLAQYKTQIYLYGNTADTVLYPADSACTRWRLGALREALFELAALAPAGLRGHRLLQLH